MTGDPAQRQGEDPISTPAWQRPAIARFQAQYPNFEPTPYLTVATAFFFAAAGVF